MNRRQFLQGLSAIGISGLTYTGIGYWPESGLSNPCLTGLPDELKHHPSMQQVWQGLDPYKSGIAMHMLSVQVTAVVEHGLIQTWIAGCHRF